MRGIDLLRRSVIMRMAVDDAALETVRIENDPIALAGAGANPRWRWKPPGLVVGCGRDRRVRRSPAPGASAGDEAFAYQWLNKDESDARLLADLLRIGRLPFVVGP